MRIVLAITGASGSIYGIRLAEKLARTPKVELHLILSRAGERTLYAETGKLARDVKGLADYNYPFEDIGSSLASGSYSTDAMVIAPCSIQTMSAIAHGISSNLIVRAADVTLKERRKLVLMVRESPFHLGHLRSMVALSEMGAIIAPPIPGFYHQPESVMDLVDHSVDRVLDLIGCPAPDTHRWNPDRNTGVAASGASDPYPQEPTDSQKPSEEESPAQVDRDASAADLATPSTPDTTSRNEESTE